MDTQSASAAVEAVFSLFERYGDGDYIGEPVSQLEHALQAADAARRERQPDKVVLAALLHDIGHLVGQSQPSERMVTDDVILGVTNHERLGAEFLRGWGFPEQVALLVENHVQAKRYLTSKHKEYYDKLSPASRATLVHQGGPMSPSESQQFEQAAEFETILRMRRWDEQAKKQGATSGPLQLYKSLCLKVLTGEC